jgi:hypothetical protein
MTRETIKPCHTVRFLARHPMLLHRMNISKTLDPALEAARDDKEYRMTKRTGWQSGMSLPGMTRKTIKPCHTVRFLARHPMLLHRMNISKTLDPALEAARDDKEYRMTKRTGWQSGMSLPGMTRKTIKPCHTVRFLARYPVPSHRMTTMRCSPR